MTHVPKQEKHNDSLPLVLAGGAFMVGLLAAVVYVVVTLTSGSNPPAVNPDAVDKAAFCEGWTSGLAVSVANAGIPADQAIAWAAGPEAPACQPEWATEQEYGRAWCEGMARGYIHAGVYLVDMGEPPQGRDEFVGEFIPECVTRAVWEQPPVPRDTLIGGGGIPPRDG